MKNHTLKKIKDQEFMIILFFTIFVSSIGYNLLEYLSLRSENIELTNRNKELGVTVNLLAQNLHAKLQENNNLSENLRVQQANNDFFQGQIQNMAGTVNTLEKLSKTDPELLKKYSKIYFLNENYTPKSLSEIDQKYLNIKNKPLQILTDVWPHLEKLLDDASANNMDLQIISAYRSFGTQTSLKGAYKVTYGAGTANSFSADQGYSEHQLGTAVDFTTTSVGTSFTGFDKTSAYKWLSGNAYKYGFIMSYPKENTYYVFEPWHFRFVGVALATRLHDQNIYFYALDQRDIDQYLANLFD